MKHRYRFPTVVAAALALVAATLYVVTTPALAAPPALGTPAAPRIQSGPYTPNQLCSAGGVVVAASDRIVLAASPTPLGRHPGLRATFEISDSDGQSVIIRTIPILPSGRVLALTLEPETLSPGTYRFRLRAEQGNTVSDWTQWCGFAVND